MIFTTPIGSLHVAASAVGLTRVAWVDGDLPNVDDGVDAAPSPVLDAAREQLEAYAAGELRTFDVPLDLAGMGTFQRRVLDLTAAIGYGETRTYGQIANELGEPGLVRAVGGALRHNPIAVVIPCHRVVAADGALTGYGGGPTTGGRLDVKRALLELEQGALQQRLW